MISRGLEAQHCRLVVDVQSTALDEAHPVRTGIPVHDAGARGLPGLALAVLLVLRQRHMQRLASRCALHALNTL